MRNVIDDQDLEQVVGGTVMISESRMKIKFTKTTGTAAYDLNCSFADASVLSATMYGQYIGKSAVEYENACRQAFIDRGWISENP